MVLARADREPQRKSVESEQSEKVRRGGTKVEATQTHCPDNSLTAGRTQRHLVATG